MKFIGKILSYNDKRKVGDIQLFIEGEQSFILKDVKDTRSTFGGGIEIIQPLLAGDIVIVEPIFAPTDMENKKIKYNQINKSNSFSISSVIKTSKNPTSNFTYEDSNNKISLDGKGQGSFKIGNFDLFDFLNSILKNQDDLIAALKAVTSTTVTQGGAAVGTSDIVTLTAKLAPLEVENKKLKTIIEGAKGK